MRGIVDEKIDRNCETLDQRAGRGGGGGAAALVPALQHFQHSASTACNCPTRSVLYWDGGVVVRDQISSLLSPSARGKLALERADGTPPTVRADGARRLRILNVGGNGRDEVQGASVGP